MEMKSIPEKFSLWDKTFKARLLRFLLISTFLLTGILLKTSLWVETPLEFRIARNDKMKTYEKNFKVALRDSYFIELIDPNPTNLEESKQFLNQIKIKGRIQREHETDSPYYIDTTYFNFFRPPAQDFKTRDSMLIKPIDKFVFSQNKTYQLTIEFLEFPQDFLHKKEIIFKIRTLRFDCINPSKKYIPLLALIWLQLVPSTIVFILLCYKSDLFSKKK